jgi:hypothetical protein
MIGTRRPLRSGLFLCRLLKGEEHAKIFAIAKAK